MVNTFRPFDSRVRSIYNYMAAAQAIDTRPYYQIYGTQNCMSSIWALTRWMSLGTTINDDLASRYDPLATFVDDMATMQETLPQKLALVRSHVNDWSAMIDPNFDRQSYINACFQTSTGAIATAMTPVIPDFVQALGLVVNIAAATVLKQSNITISTTLSDGYSYNAYATALQSLNNSASGVFDAKTVTNVTNAVNKTVAILPTLTVDTLSDVSSPAADIGSYLGLTTTSDLTAAFDALDQPELQSAMTALYNHVQAILGAVDDILAIRSEEDERMTTAVAFLESAATALTVPSLMKDPLTASVMQKACTNEFYITVLKPLVPNTVTYPDTPFQPDPTPVVIPDPTLGTPDPNNPYAQGEADSPVVGGDQ
jgi:hypothetical protein